jgi:hypothetical protein
VLSLLGDLARCISHLGRGLLRLGGRGSACATRKGGADVRTQ